MGKAGALPTQSAGDDVHLVHDPVSVPYAASSGPVQAHGMNLIHKGDGTILVGNITHLLKGANST